MMIFKPATSISMLALLSLAACSTTQGDFPPLSKRPFEKSGPIEEPTVAAPAASSSLPAPLAAQANALLTRSETAAAAFARARPQALAAARAASGAGIGSEGWIEAHMLLSRLDATRSDGVAALSEIDRLIAAERLRGADDGIIALLATAQQEIAGTVIGQNEDIAQLHRTIGR
jgi:hypothetical protein